MLAPTCLLGRSSYCTRGGLESLFAVAQRKMLGRIRGSVEKVLYDVRNGGEGRKDCDAFVGE